ncbi:thiamine pyrophosphate enzyme-like protein [Nocardia nova SH22a]|uniref:acetolactate synthase n=1 Tax=Nocardia nova SH22a TaxID=1415166 RepID=W5TSG1_9NOCA|nr:thiamine pyrophosphate-binding protein [Nocardia nova]AHH22232.1 thiamine pyrophosphate enzyme-like protein [Nocardia nova SH22a]
MPTRVVDYLVRAVSGLGVRHIFGVDGANIEDLYDAAHDAADRITAVVAKHEFAAATMADGYARSTSGLGVVCATSGGGAMNLVAGLAESYASRVPVLALVGQAPTDQEGRGAFQDSSGRAGTFDAAQLFDTISLYCARVRSAESLPGHLSRAIGAARAGGPAVLLLPKDIQQAEMDAVAPFAAPRRAHGRDERGIARVSEGVCAARAVGKVVIIAGAQVARDDARAELRDLAAVLDAGVGVAPDAKDVYGRDDHGFLGVAGSMGHPELADALRGSALCLLVGTRMPVTARAGLESVLGASTASVGAEPPYIPAVHATSTDLAGTLRELTMALGLGDGAVRRADPPPAPTPLPVPPADGPGLRYRDIIETLDTAIYYDDPDTDVFADAGNTGASVVHHLRPPCGGRFVVALGMGGMGYAFGAAIGSCFARRRRPDGSERRTVVVAGDGAFYMHGMEIHTAVEYGLPVTFVVLDNSAHAMCVTREQLFYGDRYSFNRFHKAHIGAGIAAMFPGLPSFSPRTGAELTTALRHCMQTPGPSFVSVDCDADEIPPFIPFLSASRRNP